MEIVSLIKKDELLTKKSFEKNFNKLTFLLEVLRTKNLSSETISIINKKIETINSFEGKPHKYSTKLVVQHHNITELVRKQHGLVTEKYYQNQWMALGMTVFGLPLGVIFSTALGNMAFIGIFFLPGMFIGAQYGKQKDKKALQEGKQLILSTEKS
ncbi:hypothetical protein WH52_04755 [Tenacibaculum holothuriorum]|uniref:Uncharacterized protein n=1 Tax=Tenacibaculum holothuriorum TaxID=1635173 RepID=A0A1Y2PEQ0_9FLAO|nr:hypothetical protein [Tenacibaculum holothuriorum]OSY88976.1 hypothetical protein WH52_04755 [Tenacibaculum holothuriorum]